MTVQNFADMKPPMPLVAWILGGVLFLYGLAALFDLFMSFAQGENYYRASGMSDVQIAYFVNQPTWAIIAWVFSVWGSVFGAASLLMRKPWAHYLFLISVLASTVYMYYTHILTDGRTAMGVLWPMPIVLTLIMIAMALYCRRLACLGILR